MMKIGGHIMNDEFWGSSRQESHGAEDGGLTSDWSLCLFASEGSFPVLFLDPEPYGKPGAGFFRFSSFRQITTFLKGSHFKENERS